MIQKIKYLVAETIRKAGQDDIITQGAAIAFYTIFSFAPLFILIVALGNLFLSQQMFEAQIKEFLPRLLDPDTVDLLTSYMESKATEGEGLLTTIFALVIVVFGATAVIGQLKSTLNRIWNVSEVRIHSVWNFLLNRLLSFGIIILISLLLIFSLLAEAAFAVVAEFFVGLVPDLELALFRVSAQLGTIGFSTIFFLLIFKILPDVNAPWKDLLIGSLVTTFLFLIGKYIIGFYFTSTDIEAAYRAAGSLVILILWVYYNVQTILLGAVFTQVYTKKYGGTIQPYRYVSLGGRADRPDSNGSEN
ncbi:YihY/virulence factor BrkB family protein [Rhodohalobacter mucosus]|uniref:tRNA-processing RNAse BN n=1 Tax=Rhodohalobacter mucosus TaxID=2079485 RepID=A0A316TQN5_9BACT|nr:YihY/virulence factor BrkB family protein [Rhodohalobacter mucosus]PWN06933.1 hypothetical protein DDZ15_06575 [Rhodohalobacter mucosus]